MQRIRHTLNHVQHLPAVVPYLFPTWQRTLEQRVIPLRGEYPGRIKSHFSCLTVGVGGKNEPVFITDQLRKGGVGGKKGRIKAHCFNMPGPVSPVFAFSARHDTRYLRVTTASHALCSPASGMCRKVRAEKNLHPLIQTGGSGKSAPVPTSTKRASCSHAAEYPQLFYVSVRRRRVVLCRSHYPAP